MLFNGFVTEVPFIYVWPRHLLDMNPNDNVWAKIEISTKEKISAYSHAYRMSSTSRGAIYPMKP